MYFGSLEGWAIKAKLDLVRVEPFAQLTDPGLVNNKKFGKISKGINFLKSIDSLFKMRILFLKTFSPALFFNIRDPCHNSDFSVIRPISLCFH